VSSLYHDRNNQCAALVG